MKVRDICAGIADGSHNPPQGIEISDYLMLSSKNIFDDEITFDDPRYLTQADFEQEDRRTKVKEGDVLLTIVGTVGRTAVVDKKMPRFTLQRSVAVLKPKADICSSRYLMYALQGERTHIENSAKGVAQKGIYLNEVSNIDLRIPALSEQESIVIRLDKIVSIIHFYQQQLQKLDELIKSRFVEMFGDPLTKTKYPKRQISDLGIVGTGNTPSMRVSEYYESEDIPFIKPGDIAESGVTIVSNANTAYISESARKAARIMPYNAVMVTCIGTIGKVGIVQRESACNQQINYIIPNALINSMYLAQCLSLYKPVLEEMANAPVVPIINKTQFSTIALPVPPLELQNRFAAFVAEVDKSKLAVKQSLEKLETLKKSLMQRYFG